MKECIRRIDMFILGILVGVVITAVIVVSLYIKYFYRDPDAPIGDMEYWSTNDTPEHRINIINRFIKRGLEGRDGKDNRD